MVDTIALLPQIPTVSFKTEEQIIEDINRNITDFIISLNEPGILTISERIEILQIYLLAFESDLNVACPIRRFVRPTIIDVTQEIINDFRQGKRTDIKAWENILNATGVFIP